MLKSYLFLIIAACFNAISSVFYKYSAMNSGRRAVLIGFIAIGTVFALGNVFLYTQSLKSLRLSVAYPIFSVLSLAMVTALSVFLFKDSLSLINFTGFLFLLGGIYLATL